MTSPQEYRQVEGVGVLDVQLFVTVSVPRCWHGMAPQSHANTFCATRYLHPVAVYVNCQELSCKTTDENLRLAMYASSESCIPVTWQPTLAWHQSTAPWGETVLTV